MLVSLVSSFIFASPMKIGDCLSLERRFLEAPTDSDFRRKGN